MSFSKAKIQRFNECENTVPPPGAYDPKFDTKVKGLVIEKSERFHDNKSAGSAECVSSMCAKCKNNAAVNFQTPQPVRKTKRNQTRRADSASRAVSTSRAGSISSGGTASKSCSFVTAASERKIKYGSEPQLAELKVECSNKDRTIQELEKHIEDMKEEIWKLEIQLQELRKKESEVEEQHQKDIKAMAKLQQEVLNDHDENHRVEMERLRCQLLEVSEERVRENEARQIMDVELRNRLTDLSNRAAALESELANKKYENLEKIESLETRISELVSKMKHDSQKHSCEVESLEQEMSKLNSCITDLTDERDNLKLKLQNQQHIILELQGQLSTLQCELDELVAEYEKFVRDATKQLKDHTHEHQEEIDNLQHRFKAELEVLKTEKESAICRSKIYENKATHADVRNCELQKQLEEAQANCKEVSNRLWSTHQELDELDRKYNLILNKQNEDLAGIMNRHDEEILKLKQQLEDAKLEHSKEMENLKMERDKEILEIEQASVKKIEEKTETIKHQAFKMAQHAEIVSRETLAACRIECEDKIKRVIAESDVKVNAMVRETKSTVEEEMRLTAERYKMCLERAERERAALDEKLAQKDAEITKLSATLEELKFSAETQESFGQSLQIELDRAETELAEKKEELRALKDQIRAESAEMVARRKRFEVVMAENQASVAALSSRLAQSNAEVERLQYELKRGESSMNEHRDLLNIMRNNSQMVHEQVQDLMDQLDAKKDLIGQLEIESLNEVESLKSIFEAKIDDLKETMAREITKLRADYDEKTAQNVEMKEQLCEMSSHLATAQDMLLKLEERNDAQEVEIARLELLNKKLKEKREEMIKRATKILNAQSEKHETALSEANARYQELWEKVKSLEEKERDVQEYAELIEKERNKNETLIKALSTKEEEQEQEKLRREAVEEEVKKLAAHNKLLAEDYREISEKYAEVVGHQNHKQRIKHVSQLKDKLNHVEQDLLGKNRMIENLHKVIAKLKADEKRAHSKGKENLLGVPRTAHTTPVSSPHKPLTPLRNRNE